MGLYDQICAEVPVCILTFSLALLYKLVMFSLCDEAFSIRLFFWKFFQYPVDFKSLFLVICKLTLTVYIFFCIEVLCILKTSLVIMPDFYSRDN